MIAAICSWHEHHEAAIGEIERRLGRREAMVVAAPALVETYAVLTRLLPHTASPLMLPKTLLKPTSSRNINVLRQTRKITDVLCLKLLVTIFVVEERMIGALPFVLKRPESLYS